MLTIINMSSSPINIINNNNTTMRTLVNQYTYASFVFDNVTKLWHNLIS